MYKKSASFDTFSRTSIHIEQGWFLNLYIVDSIWQLKMAFSKTKVEASTIQQQLHTVMKHLQNYAFEFQILTELACNSARVYIIQTIVKYCFIIN